MKASLCIFATVTVVVASGVPISEEAAVPIGRVLLGGAASSSPPTQLQGPCDILAAAGNPCFAAHSTVRALYGRYHGPLYSVKHNRRGTSANVSTLKSGGFANAKEHEAMCPNVGDCVIDKVFDQSSYGNHLVERDDTRVKQVSGKFGKKHKLVDASKHKIIVGENNVPVYGMWFDPDYGMHANKTKAVAKGNDPETIYAVMTGKRFGNQCCFDYGNSETDDRSDGAGTMEAIYFGNARWDVVRAETGGKKSRGANEGYKEPGCIEASPSPFFGGNRTICDGTPGQQQNCCGPWVGADLEFGMYFGANHSNPQNKPLRHDFVSLMLKGRTNGFALKGGDATRGKLETMYDGPRPPPTSPSARWPKGGTYQPMKKRGAIILGTGGDQSNGARGNFYEGFLAAGATSDATDDAVQANIAGVGYKMAAP